MRCFIDFTLNIDSFGQETFGSYLRRPDGMLEVVLFPRVSRKYPERVITETLVGYARKRGPKTKTSSPK